MFERCGCAYQSNAVDLIVASGYPQLPGRGGIGVGRADQHLSRLQEGKEEVLRWTAGHVVQHLGGVDTIYSNVL